MPITEQRRKLVEQARQAWIRRLIDLSRRNNLLYYRPLKTGTLDLRLADAERVAELLSGEAVPISKLVDCTVDEKLRSKIREIVRRALSNAEEKGLATLFAALGMANWSASDGGRNPESPVLLLPVEIELKGRLGQSLSIRRTGGVQVNLVLLHVLENEFGAKITPDGLIPLLQGDDEGEIFDPSPVYARLSDECKHISGFEVRNVAVLGNFAFQKMAMVNDLREGGEDLVANEIVSALAGDSDARKQVGARNVNPDPRDFDRIPPQDEFLILDADSSQQTAIAAVLKGQSAVVHGPPGTGKSQTIANLIASLAAQGRRVLFVAEKRAALEVVKKRLNQVGLEHMAIDMHGADVSPRLVLEKLGSALETVRTSTPVDHAHLHQRYVERRDRLNRHVQKLHKKRDPEGLSVYELQGRVLSLQNQVLSRTRWRGPELKRIADAETARVRDLLKEAGGFASLFRRTDSSPWTGAKLSDGARVQEALDLIQRLVAQTWPDFERTLAELCGRTQFTSPKTINDARRMISLLASTQRTLSLYSSQLYAQDIQRLLKGLQPGCTGRLSALWSYCMRPTFRQARKEVLFLRKDRKAPAREMHAELITAEAERLQWMELSNQKSPPTEIPDFPRHHEIFDNLSAEIRELESFSPKKELQTAALSELRDYVQRLAEDSLTPHKLPKLTEIELGLETCGAGKLIAEIRSAKVIPEKWEALFDQAWYSSCLDAAFLEDPEIAGFNGRTHDDFVQEFRDLDKERIRVAVARVRRTYAERAIALMNEHPDQEYLVRAESQKKRRHLPLRKLFAQAHEVLTAVCPCWMASPLSVSQLLDGKKKFDVVIFDEASQVLPEDAVPAILRATHLVVAGDSRQLPPTTFFASGDDELSEEEMGVTEGYESLLDTANSFIPSTYLNWHYRSRDEALISFSNHHIYGSRLVTFPGPGGPPAVRHVLVNQPPGVDGQEDSCSEEVRRVVELVLEHAAKRPEESLGVIAMGIRHADRIQSALDEALERRADLGAFFDANAEERFFAKNLERVQGDERDAIILTVGYGKDRGGNLPFRFGPLLSQGGQRRLNVAVTRARQRMALVSSFSHLDMNPERIKPGTGVELLRFYLQYAATEGKRLSDASPTEFPMNDFEAEVYDTLRSKDIPLIAQVGSSRFRIDLVAQHPKDPGRFVLAIECDGASYHSSPTARDRDRLRQQQLQNLGWRFHRIWSTDWFMRKADEVGRAIAAYKSAVVDADARRDGDNGEVQDGPATRPTSTDKTASTVRRSPRPLVPVRDNISEYNDYEIRGLIRWINSDGQLRTDDQIIDELLPELGFSRRGVRIEAVLRAILADFKSSSNTGPR